MRVDWLMRDRERLYLMVLFWKALCINKKKKKEKRKRRKMYWSGDVLGWAVSLHYYALDAHLSCLPFCPRSTPFFIYFTNTFTFGYLVIFPHLQKERGKDKERERKKRKGMNFPRTGREFPSEFSSGRETKGGREGERDFTYLQPLDCLFYARYTFASLQKL